MSPEAARDHVADYLHSTGPYRDRLSPDQRRALYGMADGFGPRTQAELDTINGGWDWSHIRDASDDAVLAMSAWLNDRGHGATPTSGPASGNGAPAAISRSGAVTELHAHRIPLQDIVGLQAAQDRIRRELGSFWITTTVDGPSASATIGPDYNGPDGPALEIIWPVALCHAGFRVELVCEAGQAEERDAAILVVLAGLRARAAMTTPRVPETPRDLQTLYAALLTDDDHRALSLEIHAALGQPAPARQDYLTDLSATLTLIRAVRPMAAITAGLCYLSGHATLSDPDGGSWSDDIEPGDGTATVTHQCLALLRCLLQSVGGFQVADEREDEERP